MSARAPEAEEVRKAFARFGLAALMRINGRDYCP
jgi:hypothetical protein